MTDTATVITGTCALQAGDDAWGTFRALLDNLQGVTVDVDGEDFTFLGVEQVVGDVDNLLLTPYDPERTQDPRSEADVEEADLVRKAVTTVNLITIY